MGHTFALIGFVAFVVGVLILRLTVGRDQPDAPGATLL